MKITAKARYAVMGAMELGRQYKDGIFVATRRIAHRAKVPEKYIIQIFQILRSKGLIQSRQGKKGGYRLAQPPEDISLADILGVVQGEIFKLDSHCPELQTYDGKAFVERISELQGTIQNQLEKVSIAALLQSADKKIGSEPMYYI